MDFFQIVCERLYNNNQFIITQSEEHVLSHMVTTNNSILKYFSKEISDTKGTKQSKINNTESDVPKLEEKIFKRKINGDDEEDDSIIIGTKKPKQKALLPIPKKILIRSNDKIKNGQQEKESEEVI